jgi:probable HAF family extracellular repeat protein
MKHVAWVLAVLPLLAGDGQASAGPLYTITMLDNLGANPARPAGINDAGHVVGSLNYLDGKTNPTRPFLYRDGKVTDLGTLGSSDEYAVAINASGQVIGGSWKSFGLGIHQAFLYRDGTMAELGTLGGKSSYARAINNHGQVVGNSHAEDGSYRAFLYSDGKMTEIPAPDRRRISPQGINDSGQVVGRMVPTLEVGPGYEVASTAFLLSNGKLATLGTLGGDSSWAQAINNSGHVVGTAQTKDGSFHAFLHRDGKMIDLGTAGHRESEAHAINEAGQIVGGVWTWRSFDQDRNAFLYSDGKMMRLDDLLVNKAGWHVEEAVGINNKGQIIAWATHEGNSRTFAVLLTPVEAPEPGSLTLVGVGTLGLAGYAWRRRRFIRR